jgi:hypothetical protein
MVHWVRWLMMIPVGERGLEQEEGVAGGRYDDRQLRSEARLWPCKEGAVGRRVVDGAWLTGRGRQSTSIVYLFSVSICIIILQRQMQAIMHALLDFGHCRHPGQVFPPMNPSFRGYRYCLWVRPPWLVLPGRYLDAQILLVFLDKSGTIRPRCAVDRMHDAYSVSGYDTACLFQPAMIRGAFRASSCPRLSAPALLRWRRS